MRCFACGVSWATWLLFTGVPARCVVLLVRCPGPLGSCSPVYPLCALPVCAVSWTTWLLFTGVPAWCVVLLVRCPGPLGSCSTVCRLGVLCCVYGVLGHLAPVHRCARSGCGVACAVSWATRLLFTGGLAVCAVWRVWCPGPPGSCSPVCPLGALLCACGVLGHLDPVHRCAARCVAWVCGVLGHLAPVPRCARSARCVACAVSWATLLLFTGVPAVCAVWRVQCPGPPGSCSLPCPLGALLCAFGVLGHLAPVHRCAARCVAWLCGVLGHLAPVHRCARLVCCFACAVSWATPLLFTGVPARCVALRVRCPGPLGSCSPVCRSVCCLGVRCPGPLGCCSPVCPVGVLFFLCSVLGHLAPVHWCARSARCLCLRSPGRLGSCSPVCPLGALFCLCGVLGHLAPVHRRARSVCCVACAVSWATLLLFTGVSARCVVLRVRCPGPRGSSSPVRSPRGPVRCPRPLGSCSPVCALGVLCCGLRVWGVATGRSLAHPDVGCSSPAGAGHPLGTHSSVRTAAVRSRQGLGTLRAHTRPSGRRLFRSGQGLGSLPGAHTFVRTAACLAWHLSSCRGSLRVRRALRVCATRRPSLLGTCPCALVVACGVPLWRASWPRVVRRASSGPFALGAPVSFPDALVPFPTPGACAPGFTGWLRGARGARPRTGLIVPAAGPRQGRGAGLAPRRTRSGPRDRVVPAGPSGVGLGLRALRWLACVDPVTDASGFPYRLSFHGGLGQVHQGCFVWTPAPPLEGRRTPHPGPVRVCVCLLFLAGSGGLASRARFGAPHLFLWPFCLSALLGPLRAGIAPVLVLSLPSPPPSFFFRFSVVVSLAPPLSLAFFGFRPRVPLALALCVVCFVGLALLGSPCALASLVLPGRWLLFGGLLTPFVSRCCCRRSVRCLFFYFFLWAPSLSSAFSSFRPRVPLALALCFVCFGSLRLPGSPCALASFVCPAWPLLSPWWLLPSPPPPFCVSRFSSLPRGAPFFFLLALCAAVVSCFLWFPAPGALSLSAVRFLLCWPPASQLSVRSRLFRAFRLAVGCSLVVAAPLSSRGFCRCRSVLCAVCCAVLCVPGCGAAPRCCAFCRPVLCCCVLCCFVAFVWCRCLLCRAL